MGGWRKFPVLTILLLLGGCKLVGNGEGYPGEQAPPGQLTAIAEGTYYWIDPGYRCQPGTGGESVPSYRNSIRVEKSSRTMLGDRCHQTAIPIPSSEPLDFWGATSLLGYREGIFERRDTPPDSHSLLPDPYTEAWCRQGGGKIELRIRRYPASDHAMGKLSLPGQAVTEDVPVRREESAAEWEYLADTFRLNVPRPDHGPQGLFPARLTLPPAGESSPTELNLECRLSPGD